MPIVLLAVEEVPTYSAGETAASVAAAAVLFVAAYWLARWRGYDVWGLVRGEDGRRSTSRFQALAWTLGLAFALVTIAMFSWFDREANFVALVGDQIKDDYLLVLGGPFAALVGARAVTSTQVRDGETQKVSEEDGSGEGGLVTNDDGGGDLVDFQFLVFNLIALGYFLVAFLDNVQQGLPDMPTALLGLTSGSALTYVANKAASRNAPVLAAAVPAKARHGEEVKLLGRNFVPSGAPKKQDDPARGTRVTFGGEPARVLEASATEIRAEVPEGVEPGQTAVEVVTAGSVGTDPLTFTVVGNQARLDRIDEAAPRPGETIHLRGRYFLPVRPARGEQATVLFGGRSVPGRNTTDTGVEADVPVDLDGDEEVEVQVSPPGGEASTAVRLWISGLPRIVSARVDVRSGRPVKLTVLAHDVLRNGRSTSRNRLRVGGLDLPGATWSSMAGHDQAEANLAGHAVATLLAPGETAAVEVFDTLGRPSEPFDLTVPGA